MEITKEYIDSLFINEVAIMKRIADALSVRMPQISAVVGLLREDCTVPFIARYRKEATGNLDEVQVRDTERMWQQGNSLEERRIEIIRAIYEQGKLTDNLLININKSTTLTELEDIYAPYKRKKKTRGMMAAELGLQELADKMLLLSDAEIVLAAKDFVQNHPQFTSDIKALKEKNEYTSLSEDPEAAALQGAMDIIAENISQDVDARGDIKAFYLRDGKIIVKGAGTDDEKKTSVYQMYWDYTENLRQIKAHRILAINRGEREKKLDVTIDVDTDGAVLRLQDRYDHHNTYHKTAIEDALKRLLSPAIIRELRGNLSDDADEHGISIFSMNLKNLLMQQPIKGTRVLGIDPGIRTGTKCAALDETGKYLGDFKIYNHQVDEAKKLITAAIKNYNVQLIAVGNGTGSKDVQTMVADIIADKCNDVMYTVVDEDGASVYSASDIAREEFPDLDLTIRGAISIGRRLQDPLAELVKIDPKAIGVGLYQHDVNQKKLQETLDDVVESVVNNVGVNLNTASGSLLKYVSGISSSLAKKIIKYRDENGKILSREELVKVPGLGPKTFEQCAGFLKIPESEEALDNTWVHPENYAAARIVKENLTGTGNLSSAVITQLKTEYKIGDVTIHDIVDELNKPGRDPRSAYPKPIMQKGVVIFEDLKVGQTVTGKIKNVVDFGAFVDLGIKETALVHISELSDTYVKDPHDVVKVGDVLEFRIIALDADRKRISLSRKKDAPPAAKPNTKPDAKPAPSKSGPSKPAPKVVIKKSEKENTASSTPQRPSRPPFSKPAAEDDGTMYNPFAELLKKR